MPWSGYELGYDSGDAMIGRIVTVHQNLYTENSPRVNGKLVLRSNPHTFFKAWVKNQHWTPDYRFRGPQFYPASPQLGNLNSSEFESLQNAALARFTGKIRKHNASLGVTLASMKQSRDMIIDRTEKIANIFTKVERLGRSKGLKQTTREFNRGRASDFLEGEFGWMPLVTDISDALGALSRDPRPGWYSAKAKATHQLARSKQDSFYDWAWTETGEIWCTVGARCKFTNPNAYLANRLGLLALPGVAWDLIPWSFVVNMFTNMGAIVNSFTDFMGVEMDSGSVTKVSKIQRDWVNTSNGGTPGPSGYSQGSMVEVQRSRVLGVPTPIFEMRVPEMNLELAGIAISLILQKVGAINRLFGAKTNYL